MSNAASIPTPAVAPSAPPAPPPVDASKFGIDPKAKPAPVVDKASLLAKVKADAAAKAAPAAPPAAPVANGEPAKDATPVAGEPVAATEEDALDRVQRGAAKARAAASQRREMQAQREQATRDAEAARGQAARLNQDLQAVNARLENFRKDPLSALQTMGVSPEEIARRAIEANTPEARIASVHEELQAEKKELQKLRQEILQEKQQAAVKTETERFLKESADPKLYPTLADVSPRTIMARAWEIVQAHHKAGKSLTNAEVLSYMEDENRSYRKSRATTNPATGSSGKSDGASAGSAKTATPTLTNSDQTASVSVPPKLHELKPAERRAELLRRAKADMAAKSATR
jgi:hypothetical protein